MSNNIEETRNKELFISNESSSLENCVAPAGRCWFDIVYQQYFRKYAVGEGVKVTINFENFFFQCVKIWILGGTHLKSAGGMGRDNIDSLTPVCDNAADATPIPEM